MKKTNRIYVLLLCVLMLCSTVLLCACQEQSAEPESTDATYRVTVVDGLGKPYTEKIIVKFMQDGKQVAMVPIDKDGTVEKTLPSGAYSVVLDATGDAEFYYDTAAAKVTADQPDLTITMAYMADANTTTIYANSVVDGENTDYEATNIGIGSVYVDLDTDDRTYFLFTPDEAGTYQFSASGGNCVIGYYGAPHFVQSQNVGEVDKNVLSISISASMINSEDTATSIYVIGIDSVEGTANTILNVARIGDPAWNIADEPWSVYQPKLEIKDFTLPEGTVLTDFDITASTDAYVLVFNEDDRCYHLDTADGPAVYVNLEKELFGISMLDMVGEIAYDADGMLIESGTAPFRYVRDNGPDDFFKEEYSDAMRRIITARDDKSGVYPLTEDLHYILTMGIDAMGWTKEGTMDYLFMNEPGVNEQIAWMFLMCHGQEEDTGDDVGDNAGENTGENTGTTTRPDPIEDNKDEPILIGSTLKFDAEVKANHIVYYDLLRYNDATLTIKSKDAYVIYNGKTYEAKNGVVSVPNLYSRNINQPIQVAIGNKGTENATFKVTLSYPAGHSMNPHTLKVGSLTTKAEKGNDQGVFYNWTAPKNGTLTITLDDITSGVDACITVTVINIIDDMEIPNQITLEDVGGNVLSVEVQSGQKVQVIIGALPKDNVYPAATIKTTVTFE